MFSLFFRKRKTEQCNSYIDPLDYDSTAKRLNRAGIYCSYNAGICETRTIRYDSTAKRLVKITESTSQGQKCPDYWVDIDTTNKRLKYYRSTPCGYT